MSNTIFWNIILIELALGWAFYLWFDEIYAIFGIIVFYLNIAFVCTLWIMHCGNKGYRITYRKTTDEIGVYRTIEFPSVWM